MPSAAQQALVKERIALRKRRSEKECERCLRRHGRQMAKEPNEPPCDFGKSRSAKCSYCRKVGKPCIIIDTSKPAKDRKLHKVQQVRAEIVDRGGDLDLRRESVARAKRIARRFARELSHERNQHKDISEIGQLILEIRIFREAFEKMLWILKAAFHLTDWDDPSAEADEFSDFDEDDVSEGDVEEAEEEEAPPPIASAAPAAPAPAPVPVRSKGHLKKVSKKPSRKVRSKAVEKPSAPVPPAAPTGRRPAVWLSASPEEPDDIMDVDDEEESEDEGSAEL